MTPIRPDMRLRDPAETGHPLDHEMKAPGIDLRIFALLFILALWLTILTFLVLR